MTNKLILTKSTLQEKLDTDDLQQVTELDLVVNAAEQSLNLLLQHCPNLQLLNLTNSLLQLCDIPAFENLQKLLLVNCQIVSVDGLYNFPNLTHLVLANNKIDDLSPFLDSSSIVYLDLSDNKLTDINQLNYITHLPLEQLLLENNEFEYKEFVQQKFPDIEVDRCDYEIQKRCEVNEEQECVNGEVQINVDEKSIYLLSNKDLWGSPYSLLQHKKKMGRQQ